MDKIAIDTLHKGDCLELLPKIADGTVNMVLVDLPYGEIDCKWDTKIDLSRMWTQLKRIGKPNCIYAFFCSSRFGCDIINSNPSWYAYDIVWHKTQPVGFLNSKVCPLRAHEMIYIFKRKNKPKGCKSVYHPQLTKGEPYSRIHPEGKTFTKVKNEDEQVYRHRETSKRINNINEGFRYPTSVLPMKKERTTGHVTEKPVALCEWLIKTYTNPEDLVLDFCMGSGTTCVAALNTFRHYIGIEMDDKWFNYSSDRIKNTTTPTINQTENIIINNDTLADLVESITILSEDETPLEVIDDDLE